jgi:hypothetical protein
MVCCWCSISRRTLPSSIRLYRRALALSSPLKSQAPRIGQYAPRIVGAVANSGAWAWVADLTSLGSPRRVCPSGSLAATDFPESLWSERMVQPGSPPTTTGMRSSFAGKSGCPLFSFLSPSCPLPVRCVPSLRLPGISAPAASVQMEKGCDVQNEGPWPPSCQVHQPARWWWCAVAPSPIVHARCRVRWPGCPAARHLLGPFVDQRKPLRHRRGRSSPFPAAHSVVGESDLRSGIIPDMTSPLNQR